MTRSSFTETAIQQIERLLGEVDPSAPEAGLLVALSGGPDSVALLLAARDWAARTNRPLGAAHLNHRLRGADSEADESFCRDLCARLGIRLHLHAEDPRPAARLRGQGLEEAARHLRRRFFDRLLDEHAEYAAVATGHHRDDQTETVLMRLLRGTGPDGLRGIRPRHGRTLHPLLAFPRAGIIAFLQQRGQSWRLDESNAEGGNLRARMRRELLPVARDIFGPGCDAAAARLAGLLEDDLRLLESMTEGALGAVRIDGTDALGVAALLALEEALARRVVRRWLDDARTDGRRDLESLHLQNILVWLREGTSGSALDLPGTGRLVREFDQLRLEGAAGDDLPLRSAADYRILVVTGSPAADPVAHGLQEGAGTRRTDAQTGGGVWNLTCPADVLQGNLRIRNWRDGDRFQPFGLEGHRKLSDVLQDLRIPQSGRDGVLLVEDERGILWIVGLARSERTRLLPSTGRTVTLVVKERNR